MSPEAYSTRPLLDKLGIKPGLRVAVVDLHDPAFLKLLRERTSDVVSGKPRGRCDIVFLGATDKRDLVRIKEAKGWIEPNGAIWVIRTKGARAAIKDTDLIEAGLAAGLVDNKIASFSDTQGAMRFVFRLRDRPK
jgi:NADPH-dependent 2,4-dienoyl-CoA reductase/sulfur reductase-like enzyme